MKQTNTQPPSPQRTGSHARRARALGCRAAASLALTVAAACGPGSAGPRDSGPESAEMLSKVFEVDEIYRSMKGPRQGRSLRLDKDAPDELLWVTGFDAVMVGSDGETPMAQDFMCHSNIDFKAEQGGKAKKKTVVELPRTRVSPRLFTLSQGQFSIDFPDGFGIPTHSSESFFVQMQVLNLNRKEGGFQVRHKLNVDFERHDPARPLKPLFVTTAYALVALSEEPVTFGYAQDTQPFEEEASCLPGDMASHDSVMKDSAGNRFSGHFVVPPGRHTYKTLVTDLMAIPYDTTVHTIAVHLHPYAETVLLRDLTDGTVLYESRASNFTDRIGLERVESYSSAEGLPVYADHEYEIESVYDNTSGVDQDSMAVLLLYALDKRFQRSLEG